MSTSFQSSCPNLSLPLPTTLSRHCYHHDRRSIPRWEKERFRDPTSSDRLSLRLPSSAYSIRPGFDWCPSTPSDGVPGFTGCFVQCGLLDRKIYCGRRKNKKGKATTRRTRKKRAEWGGLRLLKGTFEKIRGCFLLSSSNLPLFMRSHDDNAESRILQTLQPSLPVSLRRIKLKNIVLLMLLIVCGNGAFLVSRDYNTLKQLLVFANSFWRRRRSRLLRIKVFSYTFSIHTLLKRLLQFVAVAMLTGFLMCRYGRLI